LYVLDCFDVLISKIIFLKKIINMYFAQKKLFEKQPLPTEKYLKCAAVGAMSSSSEFTLSHAGRGEYSSMTQADHLRTGGNMAG
jgi:hypothetical protein